MTEQSHNVTPREAVQGSLALRNDLNLAVNELQGEEHMWESYASMPWGAHGGLKELGAKLPELTQNVDKAKEAAANYAEKHSDQLYTAALAEAALDGVEINHPNAIQ